MLALGCGFSLGEGDGVGGCNSKILPDGGDDDLRACEAVGACVGIYEFVEAGIHAGINFFRLHAANVGQFPAHGKFFVIFLSCLSDFV